MTGEELLVRPVGEISGIGKKSAADLRELGILTLGDFIEGVLPRRYDDYRTTPKIGDLVEYDGQMVLVRGRVQRVATRQVRKYLITTAELADETGAVKATWFNQPYIERLLAQWGQGEILVHGRFGFYRDSFGITSTKIIDEKLLRERGQFVAVYGPINKVLSARGIGRVMHGLRGYFNKFPQVMPSFADYGIWPHYRALYALHFAENEAQVEAARRARAFERLFIMYLAGELDAREMAKMTSVAIAYDEAALDKIVKVLPFEMTEDQRRALREAAKDLAEGRPTNRLIQGDVGSGKTAVAFALAVYTAMAGHQAVILAPTSVLAAQHYESFVKLFGELGLLARLLTGGSADKQQVRQEIAAGRAQIVIGTTAILTEGVEFKDLALAVVDEQQRFGVGQRTALMRGGVLPHLVSMTATPIPRSLFLAAHGNLAVSIIRQKPAGRAEIESRTAKPIEMGAIQKVMRETLARGEQVYYVCARIREGAVPEAGSAGRTNLEREVQELKKSFGEAVDFLHGGMDAESKERKMWDFAKGKTKILAATSVIEVGVDNKNATLMVIRDAEAFGLSQLHQLRGRVGRGEKKSVCYFVASDEEKMPERLLEVAASQDGFALAELDLERRKIGRRLELVSSHRQHGKSELLTNDDLALLVESPDFAGQAREAAAKFMANFEEVVRYPELGRRLEAYRKGRVVID